MPDTWSPTSYLQFEDERTRAARDLLARVPLTSARRIVDVGCGPGNSTALLVARYPEADTFGIDSSRKMLDEARKALPQAEFLEADANCWLPSPNTDLVFSNATYQWVPNHLKILPRVLAELPPGGVLAVQMPDNVAEPSHQLMQQVASDGGWASRLSDAPRDTLPPVRDYYNALRPLASHIDAWQTIYNHVLTGADAIVDWLSSTALRPFLEPLSPDERAQFLGRYRERVATAYPTAVDGNVLLRFPRLFIIAVR
jgi:trans-aconitate 2-methyltransferase